MSDINLKVYKQDEGVHTVNVHPHFQFFKSLINSLFY